VTCIESPYHCCFQGSCARYVNEAYHMAEEMDEVLHRHSPFFRKCVRRQHSASPSPPWFLSCPRTYEQQFKLLAVGKLEGLGSSLGFEETNCAQARSTYVYIATTDSTWCSITSYVARNRRACHFHKSYCKEFQRFNGLTITYYN
jgi:hypothetical protein